MEPRILSRLKNAVNAEQYANDMNALRGEIQENTEAIQSSAALIATKTTPVQASNAASPGKFVNLSVPEAGTSTTCPANGWLFMYCVSLDPDPVSPSISLTNLESWCQASCTYDRGGFGMNIHLPVAQGEQIRVDYTTSVRNLQLKMVYAQGAE